MLQLHTPPALVTVAGQPALLIATRGVRCYVQVSRGPGLNHLRWVPATAVSPSTGLSPSAAVPPSADQRERRAEALPEISAGLPWIRARSGR